MRTHSLPTSSIGRQIVGEISQVAKDVAKGVASAPQQIIEGPAKQNSGVQESGVQNQSSGDTEGQALEAGQQLGDDAQAKLKAAQNTSGQGWGDSFKSQVFGQKHTQRRLAEVRRNLDREIQQVHQQKEQEEQQQKQMEDQQQQMVKQQRDEQKKEVHKQSKIKQMLGLGKGERKGTKGK